jgi:putative membrane protein insertion efficiency factor
MGQAGQGGKTANTVKILKAVKTLSVVQVAMVAAMVLAAINAQALTLAAIHAYQYALSPLAARAGIHCRFEPTCSRYAEIAIERDGVVRGSWRSIKRIARCTPLTAPGTRDDP